jgi:hypothetical protein
MELGQGFEEARGSVLLSHSISGNLPLKASRTMLLKCGTAPSADTRCLDSQFHPVAENRNASIISGYITQEIVFAAKKNGPRIMERASSILATTSSCTT